MHCHVQGYTKAGLTATAEAALKQGTDYMVLCNLAPTFGASFSYVGQVWGQLHSWQVCMIAMLAKLVDHERSVHMRTS